eukprot:645654_1
MSHHMRIRSIFLWLIIYTSFESNASNEVIEFGFKTSDGAQSHSPNPIVLTLWFNTTIYQGTTPAPTASTWYTLSMQNEPYFNIIGRNCSNITQPKVMFQLDHPDAVCVDRTRVVTQSGDWYGIDKFYRNNSLHDVMWIDNERWHPEGWHNPPFKQIVYFDTTRPNVSIDDAAWSDGTNVNSRSESNMYQCYRLTTTHPTVFPTQSIATTHLETHSLDNTEEKTIEMEKSQSNSVWIVMFWVMGSCIVCIGCMCVIICLKTKRISVNQYMVDVNGHNINQKRPKQATAHNIDLSDSNNKKDDDRKRESFDKITSEGPDVMQTVDNMAQDAFEVIGDHEMIGETYGADTLDIEGAIN